MAFQPVAGADGRSFARRPRCDEIICPFLTALYNNGDLVPDDRGEVTHEQCLEALLRTGCTDARLRASIARNAMPTLNIFKMEGTTLEHTLSTGIRDPQPSAEKFAEFSGFADAEGRFFSEQLSAAFWHYRRHPNDLNRDKKLPLDGGDLLLVWAATLQLWGRSDGRPGCGKYLTVEDLRGLWLEGRYPSGWAVREWGTATSAVHGLRILGWGLCGCLRRCRRPAGSTNRARVGCEEASGGLNPAKDVGTRAATGTKGPREASGRADSLCQPALGA